MYVKRLQREDTFLQFKKLLKQATEKRDELEMLKGKSVTDLWNEDLDAFMTALDKQEEKERKDQMIDMDAVRRSLRFFGVVC